MAFAPSSASAKGLRVYVHARVQSLPTGPLGLCRSFVTGVCLCVCPSARELRFSSSSCRLMGEARSLLSHFIDMEAGAWTRLGAGQKLQLWAWQSQVLVNPTSSCSCGRELTPAGLGRVWASWGGG